MATNQICLQAVYHFANGMAHHSISDESCCQADIFSYGMLCPILVSDLETQVMFLPKCACTLFNCHSLAGDICLQILLIHPGVANEYIEN